VVEFGLRFPILLDDEGKYAALLKARVRPTLYLIDSRGRIAAVFEGEVVEGNPLAAVIENQATSLLDSLR
jgi:peroxiredoxin